MTNVTHNGANGTNNKQHFPRQIKQNMWKKEKAYKYNFNSQTKNMRYTTQNKYIKTFLRHYTQWHK